MAAAEAVAAAWGFLDTSFPSVVFAGWILLPSWQLLGNTIVCLLSLDPQGNASSPDCWGQGTCPLLPLLWTPSTLPEVLSPSLISTHCWALLLPKGLWDVGCSFCQLSPILAERHEGTFLSGAGKSSICLLQKLITKMSLRVTHVLPGVCLGS